MMHETILQLIGSLSLAGVGALGLYIVANQLRWELYGRAALAVLSASQFLFVANRAAYLLGLITAEDAVIISGLVGVTVFGIVLNLVYMHYQLDRHGLAQKGFAA